MRLQQCSLMSNYFDHLLLLLLSLLQLLGHIAALARCSQLLLMKQHGLLACPLVGLSVMTVNPAKQLNGSPQPFYSPLSGTTRVSRCQKRTSGLVQGEINRGRHTDHPARRHSIWTNQCPLPPSPHIFYGPDDLPATHPTVSKH